MSRNIAKRKMDQRIRHTRDRLGDALMELALEKPFDAITVQQVLDRAGVSRSTFYVHYNDKDDLFISDVDEFFEGMATALSRRADSSDRIAPVRELFAHIADASRFHKAIVASGKIHEVLELGQGILPVGLSSGSPSCTAHVALWRSGTRSRRRLRARCCRCYRGGSRRGCPHHRPIWTIYITAWFGVGSSVR